MRATHARAHAVAESHAAFDTPLEELVREARVVAWAERLEPIEVVNVNTLATARVRLYASDAEIDPEAHAAFERVASADAHSLATRLVQLVVKASYQFRGARVLVVSGWRERAGHHTSGDAIDFSLEHVHAAPLAAWLRTLPRVGVGVYVHPRTQYVHLDVREPSYHWIDASPPGITWREQELRDPLAWRRDASWTPDDDLPIAARYGLQKSPPVAFGSGVRGP